MGMRFFCDSMLGKLTRFLRILGIDTEYSASRDFSYKLQMAEESERIFLTRNTAILKKKGRPPYQFIESNFPEYQLIEVIEIQDIKIENLAVLRRCLRCNTMIEPVDKESVRRRVPEYVYNTQNSFSICRRCNRVYWQGTHYERLKRFSESVRNSIRKE